MSQRQEISEDTDKEEEIDIFFTALLKSSLPDGLYSCLSLLDLD